MTVTAPQFTPTQVRFLDLLSDGQPHLTRDFVPLLDDSLTSQQQVANVVCVLRKVLRPRGEDIICEYKFKKFYYRHVRLLRSPYAE